MEPRRSALALYAAGDIRIWRTSSRTRPSSAKQACRNVKQACRNRTFFRIRSAGSPLLRRSRCGSLLFSGQGCSFPGPWILRNSWNTSLTAQESRMRQCALSWKPKVAGRIPLTGTHPQEPRFRLTGPFLSRPAPTGPDRHACAVPQGESLSALFHLGGDQCRFPRNGHP